MAAKVEKTLSPARATGSPSWYGKVFACWRNRNQISPGTVELADCDFFIVAPRRTLRVLRPALTAGWYYEGATVDPPESINDNFFSRWARRPHPSGNCRCSFRRSAGAADERVISAELSRIRLSLCEVERNARDLRDLERRVSVNLQRLRDANVDDEQADEQAETVSFGARSAKQRIVQDLETYINTLLEEVLDDTVRHVTSVQRSDQVTWKRLENGLSRPTDEDPDEPSTRRPADGSFVEIDPAFLAERTRQHWTNREGYVNPAFVGSTDALSSLDVSGSAEKQTSLYLGVSANTGSIAPEQSDCVDSGINSVETIEFQPSDQEPSFEQSLLRIIDEKLGRGFSMEPDKSTSAEGDGELDSVDEIVTKARKVDAEDEFDKLRLEFLHEADPLANAETSSRLDAKIDQAELTEPPAIELDDYGSRRWTELVDGVQRSPCDSITFRKNRKSRKPTIVFLHGFGSSADVFEHQLRYFSSLGYPCIAPDMLGHGMSSAPGRSRDYRFGKLLKDLDAVLQHYAFKSGGKCVLVAHNYGCSFATALAYKYDSSIHQLVLISGGGPTPLAPPSRESAGRCCLRAILTPLLMCGLHRDVLYSARGRQHPYCGQEPAEQWPSHMKHVLDGMIWPEGDYVFHRRIGTPTLLVHGLRDGKVSLMQECHMERTMMKAFLEAVPMAGHSPMTECPEQMNHMIHCFIDLWKNKKWKQ